MDRQAALAAQDADALARLHPSLDRLAGYYGHLAKLAADYFNPDFENSNPASSITAFWRSPAR